jgi:hypothetical protein
MLESCYSRPMLGRLVGVTAGKFEFQWSVEFDVRFATLSLGV